MQKSDGKALNDWKRKNDKLKNNLPKLTTLNLSLMKQSLYFCSGYSGMYPQISCQLTVLSIKTVGTLAFGQQKLFKDI